MRVIVIGAGEVGFEVARILASEQNDVVVVDQDPQVLESVRERLDVLTIQGNGTSAAVLGDCGIRKADMLIAVTNIDEVNIIACMMADRLNVPTTIARVRSDELTNTKAVLKAQDFGIDLVIQPEESAAAEVTRLIRRASATDVVSLVDGRLHLVGMRLDRGSPVAGKTLQEIAIANPGLTFRVMGISRGIRTILPRGNERLQPNDQIFALARPKHMAHVARALGQREEKMQHIMLLGGTQVGAKVAQSLSHEKKKRIKLIEPDAERAQHLAEALQNVLVIHGDATDIDLLAREGLGEMDAFIAVTNDEESNLVSCLMAKHLGVRKTVALLSKSAYIPISQTIGLDAAVSKKLAISREVLRYLRGKHVLSVATVYGLDAEVLEIQAAPRAPVTFKPLNELSLPRGILISAVHHRDGSLEVATGDTHIYPGDRALVFVLPDSIAEAERYFDNK